MKIKKPPFFQATWGSVSTNTPYRRPTLESFTKWWVDFEKVSGLENYDVNLIGSFCEKHFGHYKGIVRDLDIVLTGELQDEEQLYYILNAGVKLGFEHRILVDLTWATHLHRYDKWEPFCKIRIGKTFTRIMGEQAHVTEYKGDDEKRLDCGAWCFCFQEPPNSWFKAHNRYTEGLYQGLVADVREMFG